MRLDPGTYKEILGFLPFLEKAAWVIQAAHEHGLVHMDIKPSNIFRIPASPGNLGQFRRNPPASLVETPLELAC